MPRPALLRIDWSNSSAHEAHASGSAEDSTRDQRGSGFQLASVAALRVREGKVSRDFAAQEWGGVGGLGLPSMQTLS